MDEVYNAGDYKRGRKLVLWRALGRSDGVPEQKVVILSTCSKKDRRLRDILVGVLLNN